MYRSPEVKPDPRRALPAVDQLADAVAENRPDLPIWAVIEGVRRALAEARERLAESARGACRPIDDKRGTKEFRVKVAGVLARRAARTALERARQI